MLPANTSLPFSFAKPQDLERRVSKRSNCAHKLLPNWCPLQFRIPCSPAPCHHAHARFHGPLNGFSTEDIFNKTIHKNIIIDMFASRRPILKAYVSVQELVYYQIRKESHRRKGFCHMCTHYCSVRPRYRPLHLETHQDRVSVRDYLYSDGDVTSAPRILESVPRFSKTSVT